ncbi:unnamed protein product [Linum trigynum]|uniref:J domain-containing protein n=1 Tax=Linum trigynum TaxID=586398 RepID=A0AAV2FFN1_9ROSI
MECNKEEAIRAKNLAETKLQNKDYIGARKMAIKAQQLYTNLDNISQFLIICDVHCAAEQKILGTEMDWYGILKIERTADDTAIKKQYKRLALLLHPDKNKFPGAEAAFKLIGEAQRVLLDKGKRSLHDLKCRASVSKPAPSYKNPQMPTYSSTFGAPNNIRANVPGFNPPQQQRPLQQPAATQHQAGYVNNRPTFWTACPFCHSRYQYYMDIKDRSVVCQNCLKSFIAHERSAQGVPTAKKFTQPVFHQPKDAPPKNAANVGAGTQGNTSGGKSKVAHQKKPNDDVVGRGKANGSRHRKKDDFIESSDSDSSSTDEETIMKAAGDLGSYKEQPRRSVRSRHQVSYEEENQSDEEDLATPRKKAKFATEEDVGNGVGEDISEKDMQGSEGAVAGNKNNLNPDGVVNEDEKINQPSAVDTETFDLPDPEFNDFDQLRDKKAFKSGQIWTLYDTRYGMPRFHARINRVFSSGFKLKIRWLEPEPDDADEREWAKADLPVCCGKFKFGKDEDVEDRELFSHQAKWEKGSHQHKYIILPKKGEIWALFKNWDINWKSEIQTDENHREFEYDFVEVLSDFSYDDVGVSVVYLGKLKGFVSLFCRISNKPVQIKPSELFRFSHLVPSFTMTGEERKDVPKGSFELDTASLPEKMEEIDVPEISECQEDGASEVKPEVASSPAPEIKINDAHDDVGVNEAEDPGSPLATDQEILDPEFFNFDDEKAIEKFKSGQIWSLYSDEDSLPKYYARVTRVTKGKSVRFHVNWLESAQLPTGSIQWADTEMPISCGRFKVIKGSNAHISYDSTGPFSHLVNAEPAGKANEYNILPAKGEIWALYRNWSHSILKSELATCDYDVVEVVERDDLQIRVLHLERVKGFNSVFRARADRGRSAAVVVKMSELLRFSHQIPAHRLTNEGGGSLRGFWELDSGALPVRYFN